MADRLRFGFRDQRYLAAEDEGEMRQLAEAGDRVGETGKRLFQQRRFGLETVPIGARPLHRVAASSAARAEIAEVALIDREGFRQGHRDRLDVRVPLGV